MIKRVKYFPTENNKLKRNTKLVFSFIVFPILFLLASCRFWNAANVHFHQIEKELH